MIDKIYKKIQENLKIIIVGDIAVDDYRYGKLTKISPEAPIPVFNSGFNSEFLYPGMAANVCYQMKNFNVDAFLLGAIDSDSFNILKEYNLNIDSCVNLVNGRNPIKIRLYEDDFPLFRWDVEKNLYGESLLDIEIIRTKLFQNFEKILEQYEINVVILSDYDKGLFDECLIQKIISRCKDRKIIVIVDPKNPPLKKWKNCSFFKPNNLELKSLTEFGTIENQLFQIKNDLNCEGVVVTQEGTGFIGLKDEIFKYRPSLVLSNDKIKSKIGAGDAYLAVLSICLGHNICFEESCKIAFEAGAVYVQNKHNCPIKPYELLQHDDPISAKFIDYKDLMDRDFTLVFANGCFDILHEGHIGLLKYAKSLGDKLVVALNSDDSVKRIKGDNRPINSLKSRIYMLSMFEFIDFIISFEEDTPLNIIQKIKPEKIVKGGEYLKDEVIGKDDCGEVVLFPYQEGFSTTNILSKI